MRLQSVILVSAVIAALTTSTLGYTGIWNKFRQSPNHDFLEEAYIIVDQIQLWYMRPLSSNGGGKSFMKFNFNKLGYNVGENDLQLSTEHGKIRLQNIRSFYFDMVIEADDGTMLSAHNLSYDTRPVFIVKE